MTSIAAPVPLVPHRDRLRTARLVVGYAAVLGTLPYLTLKAIWLGGGTLGFTDLTMAHDSTMFALNTVTAGLDLVAIGIALAFTHDWGQRIPAWLVLVPIWVGTGLLAPMAIGLPVVGAGELASDEPAAAMSFLEPWVQPMVYGGFAWQGVALLTAFVLYARVRWPEVFTSRLADQPRGATHPVQVVIANGAAVLTVGIAALHLAHAFGSAIGYPDAVAAQRVTSTYLVDGIHGVLAVLGAVGVLWTVHRFRAGTRLVLPLTLTWLGAGAMFAWGLWGLVNVLGTTALTRGAEAMPLLHLNDLAKVLAGLVIGLAALMFLAERRRATPR